MSCFQVLSLGFQEKASNINQDVSTADMFSRTGVSLCLVNNWEIPRRHSTISNGWRQCLLLRAVLCGWNNHQPIDSDSIVTATEFTEANMSLPSWERDDQDFGTVDRSCCCWLVLHSRQSQSVSSSSPSQHPRGRRNWRAIKEALKRGNCQHDCLRFFKQWRNGSTDVGAIRTRWTALEICLTMSCVLQQMREFFLCEKCQWGWVRMSGIQKKLLTSIYDQFRF